MNAPATSSAHGRIIASPPTRVLMTMRREEGEDSKSEPDEMNQPREGNEYLGSKE